LIHEHKLTVLYRVIKYTSSNRATENPSDNVSAPWIAALTRSSEKQHTKTHSRLVRLFSDPGLPWAEWLLHVSWHVKPHQPHKVTLFFFLAYTGVDHACSADFETDSDEKKKKKTFFFWRQTFLRSTTQAKPKCVFRPFTSPLIGANWQL
jgi:hypothetical protein